MIADRSGQAIGVRVLQGERIDRQVVGREPQDVLAHVRSQMYEPPYCGYI